MRTVNPKAGRSFRRPRRMTVAGVIAGSALERFEIGNDVGDLTGVEAEFAHGRTPGYASFGKRFLETFDRIALVHRPERRRDFEWALGHLVDRVTARAVGPHDREPS